MLVTSVNGCSFFFLCSSIKMSLPLFMRENKLRIFSSDVLKNESLTSVISLRGPWSFINDSFGVLCVSNSPLQY